MDCAYTIINTDTKRFECLKTKKECTFQCLQSLCLNYINEDEDEDEE